MLITSGSHRLLDFAEKEFFPTFSMLQICLLVAALPCDHLSQNLNHTD